MEMHTVVAFVRNMPLSRTMYRFPGTKSAACIAAATAFRTKWHLAPGTHVDTLVVQPDPEKVAA